ncbi:hypothetical protein RhiirC2_798269 [Rhizophagus irregularis]|uniref:Uncharacterized protein n=1 Tax=Rhizophagus irregularis TaxID=588596 RepID=A0A2N1M6P3_9GLOM|nr:hypothetical protein RhiirC2_798269 [Rhizophagus irregularis]
MFQLNSYPYEALADICAPGFAIIDWFLTSLSSGSFPHLAVLEAFQVLDLV